MTFEVEKVRAAAWRSINPLRPASRETTAAQNFLFSAKRKVGPDALPPYYLVRFLLVDLLEFRDLGQFEKVAWSVPVEFNGKAFLVEHRKFGLGIFAGDAHDDPLDAREIARLIHRGVKAAKPFFTWLAEEAAQASALNVVNRARTLFERFEFFAGIYAARISEAELRKEERTRIDLGPNAWTVSWPSFDLRKEADHYAISTIESFFSWTEHVFILIAILRGACVTGEDVRQLARADWETKFKAALDLADTKTKLFFDKLLRVRRQVRNFVAHGSFGKEGEAFRIHSSAGAVPMRMLDEPRGPRFGLGGGAGYADEQAIQLLHDFVDHLWDGERSPARIYIQDYELPLILTYAKDGTYVQCMTSVEEMEAFTDQLAREMDRHANMDF